VGDGVHYPLHRRRRPESLEHAIGVPRAAGGVLPDQAARPSAGRRARPNGLTDGLANLRASLRLGP
jgi:hypothetical protein